MDPATIVGLTAAIQQIVSSIFHFADGVRESRQEISQLCSELLALEAALEHVRLNISMSSNFPGEASEEDMSPLFSMTLSTPEFQQMIILAGIILRELLTRLERKPGVFGTSLQRLKWPLIKDDVKRYVERLHRMTSWVVLATTSDNM